jgi:hypothetical protein
MPHLSPQLPLVAPWIDHAHARGTERPARHERHRARDRTRAHRAHGCDGRPGGDPSAAGIERGISLLKRVFGLARCVWKGAAGFHDDDIFPTLDTSAHLNHFRGLKIAPPERKCVVSGRKLAIGLMASLQIRVLNCNEAFYLKANSRRLSSDVEAVRESPRPPGFPSPPVAACAATVGRPFPSRGESLAPAGTAQETLW